MDFWKITKDLQSKAAKAFDDIATFWAEKIAHSSFTINTKKEFEDFVAESKQTTITTDDGSTKTFDHTVIIIIWEEKSDFFKQALLQFPILITKAFSQNIKLKLAKDDIKDLDLQKYKLKTSPAMLVFKNEKLVKTITGEENIEKITKSLTIDLLSEIEKY